jgi:uncharacterized protein with PIN domain
MIAVDTSVILAMALGEPGAKRFISLVGREALAIGWPTNTTICSRRPVITTFFRKWIGTVNLTL